MEISLPLYFDDGISVHITMAIEFNSTDIQQLRQLLEGAHRIVLTCHMSPDGDALGSTLAMRSLLRSMGKDARVITPDQPPRYLRVIPGAKEVMAWSSFGEIAERFIADADLVVCMDFNALSRLSKLADIIGATSAPRVLIDHHLHPENFAAPIFSFPGMSSTCELTYHVLNALGWEDKIDTEVATCLMSGIITDTGGFHYNSNNSDLYRVLAALLDRGVNKDWLMRCLVDTHSEASMRLESFAIAERMELFADGHAALITLSRDDLNKYNYKKGDTEGLVNKPLAIPGIIYSCYLREEAEYIKVSMRSVADFPVNTLCSRHYCGGGHLNAAGGEFRGTLEEAARIFRDSIAENIQLISQTALDYANR